MIDYTRYGQDLTQGLSEPPLGIVDDIKSTVKPHHRSLLESWAGYENTRTELGEYIEAAQKGVKPEEVDKMRGAEKAMEIAQNTANLSDQEYNRLLEKLRTELATPQQVAQVPDLKGPNLAQAAVAAFGALTNPQYAYDISAAPFQARLQEQQQGYTQNVQQAEVDAQSRKERISYLGELVEMANRRRNDAYSQLIKLADDAEKRGDKYQADALKARADLFTAKTVNELKDKLLVMREQYPDQLPPQATMEAFARDLQAVADADAEKLRVEGVKLADAQAKTLSDKEAKDQDDWRGWVSVQYPAGVSIGPAELKNIEQARKDFAKARGIDLNKLPTFYSRTSPATESLDFAKERYRNDEAIREINQQIKEVELEQKKLNLEQDLKKAAPESDATKSKRKQIGTLTAKVQNAKIALDQAAAIPTPDDPDERVKYFNKLRDLWIEEYVFVSKKRELAGGKAPTRDEYIRERFPGILSKIPIFGQSQEGITKSVPDTWAKPFPDGSLDRSAGPKYKAKVQKKAQLPGGFGKPK